MLAPSQPDTRTALRRVLVLAFNPFSVFSEIAAQPDFQGPLFGFILLALAQFLSYCVMTLKIDLLVSHGTLLQRPLVIPNSTVIRVVAVNSTGALYPRPLSPEQYARMNFLAFNIATITWLSLLISSWISLKLVGATMGSSLIISGYTLSVKMYETAARALITAVFLSGVSIEVVAPRDVSTYKLLEYGSVALSHVPGLNTALNAHTAFFAVWSIVVLWAAFQETTNISVKRAILAAITCYLASSFLQYLLLSLLLPLFT